MTVDGTAYKALFLSTLSLRRATQRGRHHGLGGRISIHALLAESDFSFPSLSRAAKSFLSTLSLRRATHCTHLFNCFTRISIHALLAESDCTVELVIRGDNHFYPRSPCGERRFALYVCVAFTQFLSTLSLRRATRQNRRRQPHFGDFYPRSPCGERPAMPQPLRQRRNFYPRSPCGERRWSKPWRTARRYFYPRSPCGERRFALYVCVAFTQFLSTLSLRRATGMTAPTAWSWTDFYPRSPCGERRRDRGRHGLQSTISIHALLAESDAKRTTPRSGRSYFYPRSPCGERRYGFYTRLIPIDFYPRSPCGERLAGWYDKNERSNISIHALLAESDARKQA